MASELLVQRLLGSLGQAGISSKYDVDDVLRLLEPVGVFLVVFVILVLLFLVSIWRYQLEGFAQDRALPHRVVALGVDWTSFVMKDLSNWSCGLSPFLPRGVRSIVPTVSSGLRSYAYA